MPFLCADNTFRLFPKAAGYNSFNFVLSDSPFLGAVKVRIKRNRLREIEYWNNFTYHDNFYWGALFPDFGNKINEMFPNGGKHDIYVRLTGVGKKDN
jgi:hypothetical protein